MRKCGYEKGKSFVTVCTNIMFNTYLEDYVQAIKICSDTARHNQIKNGGF